MHSDLCKRFAGPTAVLLLIAAIFTSIGCELIEYRNEACSNCIGHKPDSGSMTILFSPGIMPEPIQFTLHEGMYETGKLLYTGSTYDHELSFFLATGVQYTVVATYKKSEKKVKVIDAAKLRTRRFDCSDGGSDATHHCWMVLPTEIDVRFLE